MKKPLLPFSPFSLFFFTFMACAIVLLSLPLRITTAQGCCSPPDREAFVPKFKRSAQVIVRIDSAFTSDERAWIEDSFTAWANQPESSVCPGVDFSNIQVGTDPGFGTTTNPVYWVGYVDRTDVGYDGITSPSGSGGK
jgi:hypothetical protein